MRLIGVGEWERVEAAERAVFNATIDVRGAARSEPFSRHMARRVVLGLDGDLFPARDGDCIAALLVAARTVGDIEAFRRGEAAASAAREQRPALGIAYSVAEESRDFAQPFIAGWRAGFNFDRYRGRVDRFVSPSGAWGLIFDGSGWALLAGTERFMAAFVAAYGEEAIRRERALHLRWCHAYLADLPDTEAAAWLSAHLASLCAHDEAVSLLRDLARRSANIATRPGHR